MNVDASLYLPQVLLSHHNFLTRQALLLLACTQDFVAEDSERLQVGAARPGLVTTVCIWRP